jgi:hypothetical protein
VRGIELGIDRRPAVAAVPAGAVPGDGGDDPVARADAADPVVVRIGDVDVPRAVDGDRRGIA